LLARISGQPNQWMSYIHKFPGNGPHYYSLYAYDAVPNYSQDPAEVFAFFAGQVPGLDALSLALAAVAALGAGVLALRRRASVR
jgi:hypothetical protein